MASSKTALTTNEETFYAATCKAWEKCKLEEAGFFNFNAIYTPEYIESALLALRSAKALPNLAARMAVQTGKRANLLTALGKANNLVQDLYTVIDRSFPASEIESLRAETGSSYYPCAANENWNSADTLYTMVAAFLVKYNTQLLAGNMPAGFANRFAEKADNYSKAFTEYLVAKDNVGKGGIAKQTANHAVRDTLLQMLRDAKAVYRKNPAMKKFFTYSRLVKMVTGPGKTGIRFTLLEKVSLLHVSTATIFLQPGNHILYPDKEGIAIGIMPEGKYTFTATAPGMKTVTKKVKITTGSVRHIKLILTKAAQQTTDSAVSSINTDEVTELLRAN